MTFNLMRDEQHEQVEHLSWGARQLRALQLILNAEPDICTLNECRDILPHHPIEQFLNLFIPYGYWYDIHCDTRGYNDKVLKVATLWKYARFQCLTRATFWLAPNYLMPVPAWEWNQKVARPVGVNRMYLRDNGHVLNVWNTHLGHSELEQRESAELLPRIMQQWGGTEPSVLMGDFNFFEQRGAGSLRRTLANHLPAYPLTDIGQYARTILYNLEQNGTFVGTSIDRYCPPLGQIGDRLDHIWGYRVRLFGPTKVWNKTMYTPEPVPYLYHRDVFPSDHLPLVAYLLL